MKFFTSLRVKRRLAITGRGLTPRACWWSFALELPYPQLGEMARRLASFWGGYWEGRGGTLGWVGVVPDGEPVLISFAPQRDLLAQRFLANTVENPSHTYPQLWLNLAPGVYLAQVVNPSTALKTSAPDLVGLVDGNMVMELVYLTPLFLRRRFALTGLWVQPLGMRWRSLHGLRALWQEF